MKRIPSEPASAVPGDRLRSLTHPVTDTRGSGSIKPFGTGPDSRNGSLSAVFSVRCSGAVLFEETFQQ